MKNKYIKLFASCKLIQGHSQACIYDLERGTIVTVPNDLILLMEEASKTTIIDLEKKYGKEIIQEYIDFLLKKELIFITDEPENFPTISTEYLTPTIIHNSIVVISEKTKNDIINISNQLKKLLCRFIEFRITANVDEQYLDTIVSNFKNCSVQSILFYAQYSPEMMGIMDRLVNKYLKIGLVTLFNTEEVHIPEFKKRIFIAKGFLDNRNCGYIDQSKFACNLPTYTLSLNFNSCLYKKISVDAEGNIKNCPSMVKSHGNINDTLLSDVISIPEFQKKGLIKKDEIAKCKDCEFRYICTDCRAYTENHEDEYSAPLKCGYSPYTGEWEEWSDNPLKQKAISFYKMEIIKP